ncbi:MAG: hypothetical protein IT204_17265 [Fimbriimonadaceae bacterium]|nr:hypothetical protein [Fimbriimonadaceae bacterium]
MTATTVTLYNREQGELNHQLRRASQRGEVVTEARIELEFELRGRLLAARAAATSFASKEPAPELVELAEQMRRTAPEEPAKPALPEQEAAELPQTAGGQSQDALGVQALMTDQMARVNHALVSGRPAPEPEEPPQALDATA